MKNHFIVSVPVKPYVKKYIVNLFGDPANFVHHSDEYQLVQHCLTSPSIRYDSKIDPQMAVYTDTIRILVSQDIFYRYGWEFTRTDIRKFGKHFERKIKFLMKSYVSIHVGAGEPIKDAIQRFQQKFELEEYFWSYESIKKDYYRNKPDYPFDFFPNIIEQLDNLFLAHLSPARDKSTSKKPKYEINE